MNLKQLKIDHRRELSPTRSGMVDWLIEKYEKEMAKTRKLQRIIRKSKG